ncbi:MAG: ADP-ribosylglycohydrolase family protein [Trueperaceae bacterium]|nr:ADP-ribosylglycohydrolase family protein [Trueperaceae bacterium]MCW5820482.1 ADP-ribosylglycohydrolase family protein [Trueperaceae bacterium]
MTPPPGKAPSPERPSLASRAAGMLAGVAVGDALGMPSEFLSRETIREWYGGITDLRTADARHPHARLPAGSVTDDTDHTLLLADLLLEEGRIEPLALAGRLSAWGRSPRVVSNRFVGPSTLKTLQALEAGAKLDEVPRGGTSCGAAMRVAALAIALPDRAELEAQVVASCAVSHFTKSAISGAMAMAFALSEALSSEGDLDQIAAAAIAGSERGLQHGAWTWSAPLGKRVEHVMRWVVELDEDRVIDNLYELIGVDMYADQLVPDAIALTAVGGADPNRAMLLAANLGGDSDTLASLAGSLSGAVNGLEAIRPDWFATVERVNDLALVPLAERLLAMRARRSR